MPQKLKTYPIGRNIKLFSSRFEAAANQNLIPLGITVAQAQLLIFLDNSTDTMMPQKNLETAFGASQASIAGIVARLELKGLVVCKRDGADRRIQLVAITEQGSECCAKAFDALQAAEETLLSPLTETERESLLSALDKLAF